VPNWWTTAISAAVAKLLADASFTGSAGSAGGRDAIEKMLRESVIVYDDGTPRTKHHHQCRLCR
jgi:hypothetical protein